MPVTIGDYMVETLPRIIIPRNNTIPQCKKNIPIEAIQSTALIERSHTNITATYNYAL